MVPSLVACWVCCGCALQGLYAHCTAVRGAPVWACLVAGACWCLLVPAHAPGGLSGVRTAVFKRMHSVTCGTLMCCTQVDASDVQRTADTVMFATAAPGLCYSHQQSTIVV